MRAKYIIALFFLYISFGCNTTTRQYNEISKVELAWTKLKVVDGRVISIDSSLNYKYATRRYKDYNYYTGNISKQFWDTLNRKLEAAKFQTIPLTDTKKEWADIVEFELIVQWKNKQRRILKAINNENDSVYNTLCWIRDSYKHIKLSRVLDSIKFSTTLQLPPPEPPAPRKQ